MVAFLGMGLLGSNFVKAMIAKGGQVQVWNRTTEKATALEAFGAKAFQQVQDAVHGAAVVHLTLKDDAAVDEVLAAAEPGLMKGAVIVDHTTTSAEGAIRRTKEWKEKGYTYLHAPVFMGPQNALESTGYILVSGDQEVIRKMEPSLSKMTGKVLNYGPEEGRAAGIKLIGNCFLVGFTASVADALLLAKSLQVPVKDVAGLFSEWNPGAQILGRMHRLTSANYDQPSWELNMARKDVGLFMEAAANNGTDLISIPAIAAEMDKWIEQGFGNKDWTVIGTNTAL